MPTPIDNLGHAALHVSPSDPAGRVGVSPPLLGRLLFLGAVVCWSAPACSRESGVRTMRISTGVQSGCTPVFDLDIECDIGGGTGFCPATVPTHGSPSPPLLRIRDQEVDCYEVTTIDERGTVWRTHEVHRDPEPRLLGQVQPDLLDRVRRLVLRSVTERPESQRLGPAPPTDLGAHELKAYVGGHEHLVFGFRGDEWRTRSGLASRELVEFVHEILADAPEASSGETERPPPWR